MFDNYTHYTVDGELMKMRDMRVIVSEILGYGDSAFHMSVQDIIRLLQQDNRKVETFKPHY